MYSITGAKNNSTHGLNTLPKRKAYRLYSESKKKKSIIKLKIDKINKKKELILQNIQEKFTLGPFEAEVKLSGEYDLVNLNGEIKCDLNLTEPFQLRQSTKLTDSLLKIQFKAQIVEFFKGFQLPIPRELLKFIESIESTVEAKVNVIQKNWDILGSLQSKLAKLSISSKEFSIKQIGFEISGKKKTVEIKNIYISFDLDSIPLKLVHSFNKEFLFQAYMKMIPFGKMISNLTDRLDDPFDVSSVLNSIELSKNQFKFKDFRNIKVKSQCVIGICEIGIKQGKFQSSFDADGRFNFKSLASEITFLDELHLDKIKISVSNFNDDQKGLNIKGFLPIIKSPVLIQLTKILYSNSRQKIFGIPFSLTIINWKQIIAKIAFLQNFMIAQGIIFKSLDLIIKPSFTAPEFGVEGSIEAKICDTDFEFKLSCLISTSIKLVAEMVGKWDEPFGLKNCYIKDLLLSIGYMNFAIKGQIKIGQMKAEAAVSYDNINPANNMVYFDLQSFQLAKILSVFNVQLPKQIADILNEINIKKLSAYMVPPNGIMLGNKFYEGGFSANLDCEIFGFKAKFQLTYKKNNLKLYGQIDSIQVKNILTLRSSIDKKKGPSFDVDLGLSISSHLKIDGFLSILDIFQGEVYASADIQGLSFYSRRAVTICGLNFVQTSFRFRAGLLRISDGFLIEASFKADGKVFLYIEEELKKLAKQASQPFYQAQRELQKSKQKLNQTKKSYDIQLYKQKFKTEKAKQQYEKIFKLHKNQAESVFNREKEKANQAFQIQKKNAHSKMERAKSDAWNAHENEKNRALAQLNGEKNRASKQLQSARDDIDNSFRGPQQEVDSLLRTISQYKNARWYQAHKKVAIPGLYAAYGVAKGVLIAAQETSKASLIAAEETYKGMLIGSEKIYSGIVTASKFTSDAAIIAADKTYQSTLRTAQLTFNESMRHIQDVYERALNVAIQLGKKAYNGYIQALDIAFNAIKLSLDMAMGALEAAKGVLEGARVSCKFALNLLAQLMKSISLVLIVNELFFEFDVQKKRVIIKIDLKVLGKELKADLEISFEEIINFLAMLVSQIWTFIFQQK